MSNLSRESSIIFDNISSSALEHQNKKQKTSDPNYDEVRLYYLKGIKMASSCTESFYNYIATTIDYKEYLIALQNYSSNSHTSEFLAKEISDLVEKVGSEKFAAIVTDNASNCKYA
ncbi:hypothetical protein C2G38_2202073 [Gigaspora rosea]|uniref:DUF659 domain-containing protein n=1 Tax=Gigaspora rosea TaxID=44941 RepID=A0A397UNZ0_9GLOM|nr:hypothetical protein C2G38_2202073 [Gigaspora rosea]